MMVCGTEGCASFVGDDLVQFETLRPFEYDPPSWLPGVSATGASDAGAAPLNLWTDLHKANYRDFTTAVREGRRPLVTGEDQYKVSLVLNKIYERAGVGLFAPRV
jgi:predicted dehydrogenase